MSAEFVSCSLQLMVNDGFRDPRLHGRLYALVFHLSVADSSCSRASESEDCCLAVPRLWKMGRQQISE